MRARDEPTFPVGAGLFSGRAAASAAPLVAALLAGGLLLLAQARVRAGETLDELRARGARHYEAQEYSAAIEAFESALAKARTDEERRHVEQLLARVRTALGMELFNAGEIAQAERTFRKVIEVYDDSYARFGLGYLEFLRFEDQAARGDLERSVELDPTYARSYVLLALLDYRAGHSDAALKSIEKAVDLAPDDSEARALLERWRHELPYTARLRETRHGRFLLRSDPGIPDRRRDEVLELLVRSRREIGEALGHPGRQNVVVLLFRDDLFHRATGSRHWVGGTYDGRLKLPVPTANRLKREETAELESTVRHEMTHVILRELLPECPGWLNEGIASHFEYGGKSPPDLERRLWEGRARRVAFGQLPTRLWQVEDEETARWTYLQAYGFVEYLVERFKEFRLRLLVDAIRNEGSLDGGFRKAYGRSLSELEREWWGEVERRVGTRD